MMSAALTLAREAATRGEVPVGAVLVHRGEIIAQAHNLTETNNDPTAHAEILVIREAALKLGSTRLPECDLYVSLEPCAMCAAAISHARIRRLYFGAWDTKMGAVENGSRFYTQPTCHHAPEVYGGIQASESEQLLREFFLEKRGAKQC
jgi:tRNA(adenine34) deaminase